MQATEQDLANLLALEEADKKAITAENKLAELPQRAQLQELGKKKQQVLEKQASVAKMYDAARRKYTRIEDEQAILERKRDDTQNKIDSSTGDYRAVQSLTRDLGGISKRLAKLEEEQLEASEKLDQVTAVKTQVENAIAAMDAQALKIRDSFQHDSSVLCAQRDEALQTREGISAKIEAKLLKAYDDASRRGGGVAMARLVDNRCSTCRNVIDANRMLLVKREAPLATCPSCGRLLIVE